jgi:hypothetical protein
MNLAAGFLALFIALLGAAQTKAPDDAAEHRLDRLVAATGLTVEKSSSGLSNVLTYDHDAGRKQKVFVARAPDRADGLVFHRVYTTVWTDGKNPPDAALLRRVFSQSKKFGAFYLYVDSKGAQAIRFGVGKGWLKAHPLTSHLLDVERAEWAGLGLPWRDARGGR